MSRNDITGDKIATKPASESFRAGFNRIFGKPSDAKEKCACQPGRCWTTAQCCVDWNKRGGGKNE